MVDSPRIRGIDLTWAGPMLEYNEQGRQEILREIAEDTRGGTQLAYAMLADHCYDLGLLHYATGSSYEKVVQYVTEAARAYLRVFQLRGTQSAFTTSVVELPPVDLIFPEANSSELATGTQRAEVSRRNLHLPGEVDYSLTNSRTGLRAIFVALITPEPDLARSIAELVSDPSDATYIGPDSEVCTPNEQRLAYAMKAHVLDNPRDASTEIRFIEAPKDYLAHQAQMIQALTDKNSNEFLSGLNKLLNEHQRWASKDSHQPENFWCLPGMGLSASALVAGLIKEESLPPGNVYLPLPLLPNPSLGR